MAPIPLVHQALDLKVQRFSPSPDARTAIIGFLVELEPAAIDFCRERIADLELPSQKLNVLGRAASER